MEPKFDDCIIREPVDLHKFVKSRRRRLSAPELENAALLLAKVKGFPFLTYFRF